MAKVLGIGGVFFKAVDPKALGDWYARVLGFEIPDWGGASFPHPDRGCTVWAPFEADTTTSTRRRYAFMINLIVDDLDGVLARAKARGRRAARPPRKRPRAASPGCSIRPASRWSCGSRKRRGRRPEDRPSHA